MKINELILNEAISLTKYEDDFLDEIYKGIIDASNWVGSFYINHQSKYKTLDALVDDLKLNFDAIVGVYVSQYLQKVSDKLLGDGVVQSITFKDLNNVNIGGYAERQKVFINSVMTIIPMSLGLLDHMRWMAMRKFRDGSEQERIDYLLHVMTHMDTIVDINANCKIMLDRMALSIIHEFVHVLQHKAQYNKGRAHHAYKSYLNKSPNEIIDLLHKLHYGKLTPSEQQRWKQLYSASPQEMGAFVHNIVQQIIEYHKLYRVKKLSDLPTQQAILADIKIFVSSYIQPTTVKTQRVYNRYLKLVYQEMDRYLENLREKLSNNDGKAEKLSNFRNQEVKPVTTLRSKKRRSDNGDVVKL